MNWFEGFAGASGAEWIATLAGFICVFLLIKRNIWCFAFGLIQVSIYSWIFYEVKLYSDMLLHIIYIGFQLYGWRIWAASRDEQGHIIPETGSVSQYLGLIAVVIVSTVLLGTFMATQTDASFAYADAFTTCTSLVAQWLLSHKKLFNWSFWIVVDVVAIGIYWQKGLYPTSALYFSFLIMAIIGQYSWLKAPRQQPVKVTSY